MTATPEDRISHLEAAFLELLDRIGHLEGENRDLRLRLDFEVSQRTAYETLVGKVACLPGRMDHIEREVIALRRLPRGGRLRSE